MPAWNLASIQWLISDLRWSKMISQLEWSLIDFNDCCVTLKFLNADVSSIIKLMYLLSHMFAKWILNKFFATLNVALIRRIWKELLYSLFSICNSGWINISTLNLLFLQIHNIYWYRLKGSDLNLWGFVSFSACTSHLLYNGLQIWHICYYVHLNIPIYFKLSPNKNRKLNKYESGNRWFYQLQKFWPLLQDLPQPLTLSFF